MASSPVKHGDILGFEDNHGTGKKPGVLCDLIHVCDRKENDLTQVKN